MLLVGLTMASILGGSAFLFFFQVLLLASPRVFQILVEAGAVVV